MRILFLTNFYPPHELGGQGQSCQQVVEGLQRRGHNTRVLTSMHGTGLVPTEVGGVSRALYLEMEFTPWRHGLIFFTERGRRERHNLDVLDRQLAEFDPDLVFIWGMWNLPRSVPALAEARRPGRVVYRFAEYWPTLPTQHEMYWQAPGRTWFSKWPKRIVGRVALAILAREARQQTLRFEQAMCVSAATRDHLVAAGIPVAHARVIHTGLDESAFDPTPPAERRPSGGLRLLFAGQLTARKGLETAVAALEELVAGRGQADMTLTIAGAGEAGYEERLRAKIRRSGLDGRVTFLGRRPAAEMPALMRQHDVLLVPSVWPEPFARVVLEGMFSGLVVVAAAVGGSPEIIAHGQNGLLFAPDNAHELAEQLAYLIAQPEQAHRLAQAGWQTVRARFTFAGMLDQIERFLLEVAFPPAAVAGPRLVQAAQVQP